MSRGRARRGDGSPRFEAPRRIDGTLRGCVRASRARRAGLCSALKDRSRATGPDWGPLAIGSRTDRLGASEPVPAVTKLAGTHAECNEEQETAHGDDPDADVAPVDAVGRRERHLGDRLGGRGGVAEVVVDEGVLRLRVAEVVVDEGVLRLRVAEVVVDEGVLRLRVAEVVVDEGVPGLSSRNGDKRDGRCQRDRGDSRSNLVSLAVHRFLLVLIAGVRSLAPLDRGTAQRRLPPGKGTANALA